MDPLVSALLNFGGIGVAAAILLFLHMKTLKSQEADRDMYKEELAKERAMCHEHTGRVIEAINKLTEAVNSRRR